MHTSKAFPQPVSASRLIISYIPLGPSRPTPSCLDQVVGPPELSSSLSRSTGPLRPSQHADGRRRRQPLAERALPVSLPTVRGLGGGGSPATYPACQAAPASEASSHPAASPATTGACPAGHRAGQPPPPRPLTRRAHPPRPPPGRLPGEARAPARPTPPPRPLTRRDRTRRTSEALPRGPPENPPKAPAAPLAAAPVAYPASAAAAAPPPPAAQAGCAAGRPCTPRDGSVVTDPSVPPGQPWAVPRPGAMRAR